MMPSGLPRGGAHLSNCKWYETSKKNRAKGKVLGVFQILALVGVTRINEIMAGVCT
jgi:hypothetical protein